MDLSIYSKSLDDFKSSILEVLDKAYSINAEHFYKPNTNNKIELTRMWGDEYNLDAPVKLFKYEGTKAYLESKLSAIFQNAKVLEKDNYEFNIMINMNNATNLHKISQLVRYANTYKNCRSVYKGVIVQMPICKLNLKSSVAAKTTLKLKQDIKLEYKKQCYVYEYQAIQVTPKFKNYIKQTIKTNMNMSTTNAASVFLRFERI